MSKQRAYIAKHKVKGDLFLMVQEGAGFAMYQISKYELVLPKNMNKIKGVTKEFEIVEGK